MSDKSKAREPRRNQRRTQSQVELASMVEWLASVKIGVPITVHVNGPHYPTALVAVDLGQPLKQVRLTPEQTSELGQRLRKVAREVLGRDASIRIQSDNSHGIHWAGVGN